MEVADARIVGLAKTQRATVLGPALATAAEAAECNPLGPVSRGEEGDAGRVRDGVLLAAMPEE